LKTKLCDIFLIAVSFMQNYIANLINYTSQILFCSFCSLCNLYKNIIPDTEEVI